MSELRLLFERAVRAGVAPGVAARWGSPDSNRTEHLGSANLVPVSLPVSDSTWFDLASLTKPLVTGVLSMLAFRSGEVTCETTIGDTLTEARGTEVGDITMLQLLTHTSGFPAWRPLYCLAEGDPGKVPDCLSAIALENQPGSEVVYSCVGYVTLGIILSRLSGQSLDDLYSDVVLSPLRLLDDLGFRPDPAELPLAGGASESRVETEAAGDLGLDPKWIPSTGFGLPDDGNARFLGGISGNAGLFGTARGVFRLAQQFLPTEEGILTPDEKSVMTRSHTSGLQQSRGLGWQLADSSGCSAGPALSDRAFGHTGFSGTSLWLEPLAGRAFVLLTNRNHPSQRPIDLHPLRRRFHSLASRQA